MALFYIFSVGFFATEAILIFYGVFQLPDVPISIVAVPFIMLAILDWIMIEGIVQFFDKTRQAGVITNAFKKNLCGWQTTIDVSVSLAWLAFDAKPWEIFTG